MDMETQLQTTVEANMINTWVCMCQGNGTAPTGWFVIIILLLEHQHQDRCVVEFTYPSTKALASLVVVQFVDDANIPCPCIIDALYVTAT